MSICVILNPAAGRGVDPQAFRSLLVGLSDVDLRVSRAPGEAVELARAAAEEGFGTIAAAGGDGTMSEVVTGLADHLDDVRTGFIPVGTGNDFAHSTGIPLNVEAAVRLLGGEAERRVDVVRLTALQPALGTSGPIDALYSAAATGPLYLNTAVVGFAGRIANHLDADMRRRWGALMYLRAAVTELADLKPYQMHLTLDDTESIEVEALMVIVANGPNAGGKIPLAPDASMDDGLLDIVIISRRSALGILRLIPSALRGTHLKRKGVTVRRAARLTLESTPSAWVNVDGETAGARPFEFQVLPRALRIAAPA